MNELFGEECFVAQFVWRARKFTDARAVTNVSTDHEYILAYAKSSEFSVRGIERDESKFSNPDNDPRGLWMSRSILGLATKEQRPNLHYDLIDPRTGHRFPPNPSTGWRYSQERMNELVAEGRILFPPKPDGRPREKKFRSEMQSELIAFRTIIDGVHTADGTQEIRDIFGAEVFSFPKPCELLARIVKQVADPGDLVLDFFAGSGTTGQAVMTQNTIDDATRRYILVQIPELLDPANKDQKVAADFCDQLSKPRNIAELTKERLRRAGKNIRQNNPMFSGDLGFRVFKLDSTNIRAWEPHPVDLAGTLLENVEHLKADRTQEDILYELLLKLGLDLCVSIEEKAIAGKTIHSIGAGTLLVCLAPHIARADVEELALGMAHWHKELAPAGESTCVFRDSAFADDVAKTNLTAILVQRGFSEKNLRSL